ncbi:hypothetical protein [Actinomadura parmotrematis]|uniref:DUF320 domain-containing protein n=1 Tax=Actinomadura parmotrematis TaxID=2864039 RepID=A0ABS7FXU5_9ACTN|nr:hypothetical protein [Actinomadura parmotrematis]MBW8484975.1 hypothetical protein [Actinomadura parmotrematis]
MIKIALRTAAVSATLAGTALMAAPAFAGTSNSNHGNAVGNNVAVTIVGGYGVTCGSVSVAGQSGTDCNGNGVHNHANHSGTAGATGDGND